MMNNVREFVTVEEKDSHYSVSVWTVDGDETVLIRNPDYIVCDKVRHRIMDALVTWDGWT